MSNKSKKSDKKKSATRTNYLFNADKPTINYTRRAWEKVGHLVFNSPNEVGWIEVVEKVHDFLYRVVDARAMPQVGEPATWTHTMEERAVATLELLQRKELYPGVVDAGLGHSHVDMNVYSSPTDEQEMLRLQDFDADGNPVRNSDGELNVKWNVQTVHNKDGDVFASVWDWENGRYYADCPVEVEGVLTEEDIEDLDMQLARVRRAPPPLSSLQKWKGNKCTNQTSAVPMRSQVDDVLTPWDLDPVYSRDAWDEDQWDAFNDGTSLETVTAMGRIV